MAKKVTGYIKLQIPAGKATPAPPAGPARCEYRTVYKGIQRQDSGQGRPDHPGYHHCLRGQKFQLCDQNSSGSRSVKESLQHQIRFGRSE